MQKITPHLWFDTQAVEATQFYVDAFGNGSKVVHTSKLSGTPSGDVDVVNFELWGYRIDAISAGPYFKFTPAISMSVQCHSMEEIDRIYGLLKEGGEELMPLEVYPWSQKYGWVNDKYGMSWQLNLPHEQVDNLQRISPLIMYTGAHAGKAEEAINLYTSVFPNSSVDMLARYEAGDPDTEGTIKHGEFTLFGQALMAMDSSLPHKFNFSEALSLVVRCDSQEEIDAYWEKLSAVPASEQCGWLKDKFGVSWQIVPAVLDEMMANGDAAQVARVTQAFLAMKKFDIKKLEEAYQG